MKKLIVLLIICVAAMSLYSCADKGNPAKPADETQAAAESAEPGESAEPDATEASTPDDADETPGYIDDGEIFNPGDDPGATKESPYDKTPKPLFGSGQVNAGDVVTFGAYEQDNDSSGLEPLRWIVLKNEGGKALLLSLYVIDALPYHTEYADVTWEGCRLRQWLNEDFAAEAFGADTGKLVSTPCPADKNPQFASTAQGQATEDVVFLLSAAELSDNDLGFRDYYAYGDVLRMARATEFAKAKGCFVSDSGLFKDCATWWIRTMGGDAKQAAYIYSDGSVGTNGGNVTNTDKGVRPAVWVKLGD